MQGIDHGNDVVGSNGWLIPLVPRENEEAEMAGECLIRTAIATTQEVIVCKYCVDCCIAWPMHLNSNSVSYIDRHS